MSSTTFRLPYFWDDLAQAKGKRQWLELILKKTGGRVGDEDMWEVGVREEGAHTSQFELTSTRPYPRPYMLEVDDVFIQTATGIAFRRDPPYLLWDLDNRGCMSLAGGILDMTQVPNPPREYAELDKPIFIVAQRNHGAYFHGMIESMTRIGPFLDEVIRQDMLVLSPPGKFADLLELVGVERKNIVPSSSHPFLLAPKAFIPPASGCGDVHAVAVKLWNQILRDAIRTRFRPDESKLTVLVIKRRPGAQRSVLNHDDFVNQLHQRLPNETVVEFFGDEGWEETAIKFFSAKVVVGPHGAGFSNLVFSRPGTRAVEVLFEREPNFCMSALTEKLGLEYHGLIGQRRGPRIILDVVRTTDLVERALSRWRRDRDRTRAR